MVSIIPAFWLTVTSFFEATKEYFLYQVYPRFLEMIIAVMENVELRWVVAPLVITMIFIQIYFGRYKNEELGYQSAFGNAIVLVFVSVNLLRHMYNTYGHTIFYELGTEPSYKMLFVTLVMIEAVLLLIMDFLHSLPKKLTFLLSSSIFVNVIAFIAIIIVYTTIPIDKLTLATAATLIVALFIIFAVVKWIIPPSEEAKRFLEKKREHRREKWENVKSNIKENVEKLRKRVSSTKEKTKDLRKPK